MANSQSSFADQKSTEEVGHLMSGTAMAHKVCQNCGADLPEYIEGQDGRPPEYCKDDDECFAERERARGARRRDKKDCSPKLIQDLSSALTSITEYNDNLRTRLDQKGVRVSEIRKIKIVILRNESVVGALEEQLLDRWDG